MNPLKHRRTGKGVFAAALFLAGSLTADDSPVAALVTPVASGFYTVTPCRAVDTRIGLGPNGGPPLGGGEVREFGIAGLCGVPSSARAVALNVTVVNPTAAGSVLIYPAGEPTPLASSLNFSAGRTRANNTIAATGEAGQVSAFCGMPAGAAVDILLDVVGYFEADTGNKPPVVLAGPDRSLAMPANSLSLSGTFSDDALPAGATYTAAWSVSTGPAGVSFSAPVALSTNVTFAAAGTYTLRLTVSDSDRSSFDELTVKVTATTPDVLRFLDQASFGPAPGQAETVRTQGLSEWIEEQFRAAETGYTPLAPEPGSAPAGCTYNTVCYRDKYTTYPVQNRFFANALYGNDQLRQKVAWALHKIFVVSGSDIPMPSRLTPYLGVLNRNAFGNFRTLLGEITLNTAMGRYLDMVTSTRTRPNENYPREILQLFSIGTMRLNPDGSVQSDANGPIPTYDQSVVDGFSKAFTGWTYAAQYAGGITNYIEPMVLVPGNHDTTEKLLLRGVTLPAGRTGTQDLNDALDNIFQDPNVGPFFGQQLIRMLVTSNPSPAYVARVSFAFDDNGYGVRGDMKAVIRAVLLDPEARGTDPEAASFGRLREPALWLVASLRALGARSADGTANADGYLNPRTSPLGQSVLRPPSVFSYFPPDYEAPGAGGLLGPEFGILSATTALGRTNLVNTLVYNTSGCPVVALPCLRPNSDPGNLNGNTNGVSLGFASLVPFAGSLVAPDPVPLVNELDRRLLHGTMSAPMRAQVTQALNAIAPTDPTPPGDVLGGKLRRVQAGIYLVLTASQFQVER
jgi:PKD repeat protein